MLCSFIIYIHYFELLYVFTVIKMYEDFIVNYILCRFLIVGNACVASSFEIFRVSCKVKVVNVIVLGMVKI